MCYDLHMQPAPEPGLTTRGFIGWIGLTLALALTLLMVFGALAPSADEESPVPNVECLR
jgi:hypothetical protein